jgi:hypothetical protein
MAPVSIEFDHVGQNSSEVLTFGVGKPKESWPELMRQRNGSFVMVRQNQNDLEIGKQIAQNKQAFQFTFAGRPQDRKPEKLSWSVQAPREPLQGSQNRDLVSRSNALDDRLESPYRCRIVR